MEGTDAFDELIGDLADVQRVKGTQTGSHSTKMIISTPFARSCASRVRCTAFAPHEWRRPPCEYLHELVVCRYNQHLYHLGQDGGASEA